MLLSEKTATILESDGNVYISGASYENAVLNNETYTQYVDYNYVWYSGKMWRIISVNTDGTMKMVTDDVITSISYGNDINFYTDENTKSYMYQWLNEDFLDTLYNYENIIVTNSVWNVTPTSSENIKPEETNLVEAPVGLLNVYEYYSSYQKANYSVGYLNNGYDWWLLNPNSVWNVWYVRNNGNCYNGISYEESSGVRPAINLKSDILITSGTGAKSDPYRISGDKEEAVAGTTLINTRTSGEYVTFNNELYRIVGIENNTTKINKIVITKSFASTITYGLSNNTQSNDYWDYYLNNTWYNSLSSESQNMLVDGTYYLGVIENNYKGAICATPSNTVTTKDCEKTTTTWSGKVGLPRYGEMFASQQKNDVFILQDMWLITSYLSSRVFIVYDSSYSYHKLISSEYAVRPSINLSSTVKILGGNGTKINLYTLSL